MLIKDTMAIAGNGGMYLLTALQTNQLFQIIELVLSILISLVILCERVYTWYKKAKEDGKISKDELKDGIDIISDGAKDIGDKVIDLVDKTGKGKESGDKKPKE